MSVSCITYCTDENVEAPEIGDQGFIGYPSIDIVKDYNEEWDVTSYSFGWIYDGFKSIGLIPHYLEAFKVFLEKYNGKTIISVTDHDDEPLDMDYDNLTRFELEEEGFISGYYTLNCEDTGESFTCQDEELFRPIDKIKLSEEDVNNFLSKILDDPEFFDAFHNVTPSIDPYEDLPKIIAFLKETQGKTITVSISSESE